jgi:hypothetical protein
MPPILGRNLFSILHLHLGTTDTHTAPFAIKHGRHVVSRTTQKEAQGRFPTAP